MKKQTSFLSLFVVVWLTILILGACSPSDIESMPTLHKLPDPTPVVENVAPTEVSQDISTTDELNISPPTSLFDSETSQNNTAVDDPSPDLAIVEPLNITSVASYEVEHLTVPDQFEETTIRFESNTSQAEINAYLESIDATVVSSLDVLGTVTIQTSTINQTKRSPIVKSTEPNYYVSALLTIETPTNDPYYEQQHALEALNIPQYWMSLPDSPEAVTVAVIDSGICASHPDLAGRVLAGYDFVENDNTPQDDFGHGCSVAGIIAANVNNGIGIAGIAPQAQIMPLRVLDDSGIGTYANVAAAIVYAVDNGADVINLSLGGNNPSGVLETAVNYATDNNVRVVAAAGNSGGNLPIYPARYNAVLSVGALDQNGEIASFSNRGADVYAPGVNIITLSSDGGYGSYSGTSFASPFMVMNFNAIFTNTDDSYEEVTSTSPQPDGIPDGAMLIDGDILIPKSTYEAGGLATYTTYLWSGGIVPYEFAPTVTSTNRSRTLAAMAEWEAVANVDFIPRTSESNYVYIQNSTGNNSFVGKVGGQQILNMADWTYKFVIAHELGHALGLWHEQSRPDRDTYVQINYANIAAAHTFNFDIHYEALTHGSYDFESVMHYGAYDFSSNGQPTITVLPPNEAFQNVIGQISYLSAGDAAGMAFMYTSLDIDDFDSAETVTALPFNYTGTASIATSAVDDPPPACVGSEGHTVWFEYTPASDIFVEINTLDSNYDTVLSVWTGTRGSLVNIDCQDDGVLGVITQSQLGIHMTSGTTYYILVAGWSDSSGFLDLKINEVPSVANDDFDNAPAITSLPYAHAVTTLGATTHVDDQIPSCTFDSSDSYTVWYSYTPSSNQPLIIHTIGSSYDTILSVWTGTRGSLAEQDCNDDIEPNIGLSAIFFTPTAGTTYYILVADSTGSGGSLVLNVNYDASQLTQTISGYVTDTYNNIPISNLEIKRYRRNGALFDEMTTCTNPYGFYEFSGLPYDVENIIYTTGKLCSNVGTVLDYSPKYHVDEANYSNATGYTLVLDTSEYFLNIDLDVIPVGTISGRVTDNGTGDGLGFVTVYVRDENNALISIPTATSPDVCTDGDGYYTANNLPAGKQIYIYADGSDTNSCGAATSTTHQLEYWQNAVTLINATYLSVTQPRQSIGSIDLILVPELFSPSSLIASTVVGQEQLSLSWTDNSSDETEFRIERSPSGTDTWVQIWQVGAGVVEYLDTDPLDCYTAYDYRVIAYRSGDFTVSPPSNVATGTTSCLIVYAPTNLTGTSNSDAMDLSWTNNAPDEDNFEVQRADTGQNNWAVLGTPTATTYTDNTTTCGSIYDYRVRAQRGATNSAFNNVVAIEQTCAPPIAPSLSIMAVPLTNDIQLDWVDNSTSETNFHIERSPDGLNAWAQIAIVGENVITYTDTDASLNCYTAYDYRVIAYRNDDGVSSVPSNTASVSTWCDPDVLASLPFSVNPSTSDISGVTGFPSLCASNVNHVYVGEYIPAQDLVMNLNTFGSSFDTVLSVLLYNGTFGQVACNDDSALDGTSATTVSLVSGTRYIVIVGGKNNANGTVVLNGSENVPPPPTPIPPPTPPPTATQFPNLTTVGLFKNGTWLFRESNQTGTADVVIRFGANLDGGWLPLIGDWNKSGVDGIGLYKNGRWLLRDVADGGSSADYTFIFGSNESGWQPIVGDWNGDGFDGIGLYKNGIWILKNSLASGDADYSFRFNPTGSVDAVAIAGDWHDESTDRVGLFDKGRWFLSYSHRTNNDARVFSYGPTDGTWQPIVGDWDEDGDDTIGIYKESAWRLRNTNSRGNTDLGMTFGIEGGLPIAGYRGNVAVLALFAGIPDTLIALSEPTIIPSATLTDEPDGVVPTSTATTDDPIHTATFTPSLTTTQTPTVTPTATWTVTPTPTAVEELPVIPDNVSGS